jgi:hypothetical protein
MISIAEKDMETVQFEPMSVGRIFDVTFNLYRRNFLRFITIVAIIEVPVGLISIISTSSVSRTFARRPAPSFVQRETSDYSGTTAAPAKYAPAPLSSMFPAVILIGSLFTLVGNMLCQAALIKNISETYLGNEVTVGQTYRFVLPKLLTLLGASLLIGLVKTFGLMLLVVPGIIFGLWFSLTMSSIVVEDQKILSGMSRSKKLVAGNIGKVFLVGLLWFLISTAIMTAFTWPVRVAGALLPVGNVHVVPLVSGLASIAGSVLVAPISAAAYVLLYYDLRIRKEGFDLQMLAQSMGSNRR